MRGCVDMSSSGSFRASRRWIRWLVWAVAGGIWFLWLGYEDPGPATVVGMAAILAVAWGLGAFLRARAALDGILRSRRLAARHLLIGLAAGAGGGAGGVGLLGDGGKGARQSAVGDKNTTAKGVRRWMSWGKCRFTCARAACSRER